MHNPEWLQYLNVLLVPIGVLLWRIMAATWRIMDYILSVEKRLTRIETRCAILHKEEEQHSSSKEVSCL